MTATTDDNARPPIAHSGNQQNGADYRQPLNLDLDTSIFDGIARARAHAWNNTPALLPLLSEERGQRSAGDCIPVEILRYIWQSAARELLPKERVSKCLRELAPMQKRVAIHFNSEKRHARYGNLYVCGRLWQCPVCAARISEFRRRTLTDQLEILPYFPMMLTYTFSHDRQTKLKDAISLLSDARRKRFKAGRAWMAIAAKYGFVTSIRALEVTYGESGWHVHIHELALLMSNPGDKLLGMIDELKPRWMDAVQAFGGYASFEHGLDISVDAKDIGEYVAKVGKDDFIPASGWSMAHEVAKAVSKFGREGGRTPNQLLHDYRFAGDIRAGHIWKEYAETFKGKKQLEPASFAHLLPDAPPEPTDDEIAAAADPDENGLAWLNWSDWKVIMKHERRGDVIAAARDGLPALTNYCASMGISLELPQ